MAISPDQPANQSLSRPVAKTLTVTTADDGMRLDRWLFRHYPDLTRGQLEKLLRTGQVRVTSKRVTASARLTAGAQVRIPPQLTQLEPKKTRQPIRPDTRASELAKLILYEDAALMVINKPPGLAVQGGMGITDHLDAWCQAYGAQHQTILRLTHRLDRDTSGVMVLARTAKAAHALTTAFRERSTHKLYWAVVAGQPAEPTGQLNYWLRKQGELMVAADQSVAAKPSKSLRAVGPRQSAMTDYQQLATAPDCSWLELHPLTGRTHQLRVHCQTAGWPILGDPLYFPRRAWPSAPQHWQQTAVTSAGLLLHAVALTIPHPDGRWLVARAALPKSRLAAWQTLGFSPKSSNRVKRQERPDG